MERRLTTILAADIAGFSRLIGLDEEGTLAALRSHRTELIDPLLEQHNGRVANTAGDSLLIEFPSAVEAVRFAAAMQEGMVGRNASVPENLQIVFRIGINVGDVVPQGNDLLGDGVNVAARLEALAPPGGIILSRTVRDQVRDRLELELEDLGEVSVKNITRPIRAFQVLKKGEVVIRPPQKSAHRRTGIAVASGLFAVLVGASLYWHSHRSEIGPETAQMTADTQTDKASLAVLPFDNFSEDSALDYFSDGISEDIITTLSRFPDLAVISRNSSFVYKGKPTDIRQVGKELGATYVLEGSVRKQADKIRLTAQLIDAASGEHVWAERYDEEGTDPWALQDDVITRIVSSLTGEKGQLKQAEYKRAWGKDSGSLEEYDYYLRGHELLIKVQSKEVHEQAGAIWSEGLRKFPNSSLLRAKLAFYHLMLVWNYWSDDPVESLQQGERLAQEALSRPASSPQARRLAHWAMAWVQQMKGDLPKASAEAKSAIALASYDAHMVGDLAVIPAMAGEPVNAIALLEELQKNNSNFEQYWQLSLAYYLAGDNKRAIQAALQHSPSSPDRYVLLASSYVRLGQMDEAREAIGNLLELDPKFTQDDLKDNYLFSDSSIMQRQAADLGEAGLPER